MPEPRAETPEAESTARRHLDECPIDGCDVAFLGVTYEDAVDHVLEAHGDRLHPHWRRTRDDPEETLLRLVREAQAPRSTEYPAVALDPRVTALLDDYLVYVVAGLFLLILGWPLLLDLLL